MLVEGLPACVENLLNTLLEEKSLSSFRIQGLGINTVVVLHPSAWTSQQSTMPAHIATFHNKPSWQVDRNEGLRHTK